MSNELLGVVFGLKKFRQYLLLRRFDLFCDHESLALFRSQKTLKGKDWRWCSLLEEYNYNHYYREGATMLVPDALSRAVETLVSAPGVEECVENMKGTQEEWSKVNVVGLNQVQVHYHETEEYKSLTECLTNEGRILDPNLACVSVLSRVDPEWRSN